MANPLRVGVIGLGRRWQQRYKPALLALRDRFKVRVLCDAVEQRAVLEANRLGCQAVAGITELLEGDDVQALLLLDAQWFRLWPLEQACRLGKPVFCAAPLEADNAHADVVCRQVEESKLPVMMELAPRLAPATAQLRELLDTQLGPARLLLCDGVLGRAASVQPDAGPCSVSTALADWCVSLLGGEPTSVLATGGDGWGFTSLLLEFADGRAARITRRRAPWARRGVRLQVVAEHGSATVDLPGRVRWAAADGRHLHVLRGQRPLGQALLEEFYRAVTDGHAPRPGLLDAYRALRWLRAGEQSLAEGRRVGCP